MNRLQARAQSARGRATGFRNPPEPRSIGQFGRGRQILGGTVLFAGHLVETGEGTLWDIDPPDAAFAEEAHGFGWLDDLAAVGDGRARALARAWLWDWIDRYGRGRGPGWAPAVTGRRVIRWTTHSTFLLRAQDKSASSDFFRALSGQVRYLSRRWRAAPPGLARIEALGGTIVAGLALEGHEKVAEPAVSALARFCEREIAADGSIANRNPEHLTEILTLLNVCSGALRASGRSVPSAMSEAVERIAPTLRALRHADGGLARFHGGGRGLDGRLDHALAESGVRTRPRLENFPMGYGRLAAGRTTLIFDAAPPPSGPAAAEAHASTLAFELTSGRRPLIVNCGAGAVFGAAWRRAGRATPSHSTLGLDGHSSARLGPARRHGGVLQERLEGGPGRVVRELSRRAEGPRLEIAHDGYQASHGLTHARTVDLSSDGRRVTGEDVLATLSSSDEMTFSRSLAASPAEGLPFSIRFHLHPDVDAELDLGGTAVSLVLKSGEIWILRQEGADSLSLEPSVYLESGRLRPRPAKQVVLSGSAIAYATRIRWSLAKAQETPNALRDTAGDDLMAELESEEMP
ncbi:heparinase II/III family protein [Histidinibacterium aquaticum]|uniref:Heparinase n=1 Tax=Histidinibacterium aquaticum TaxID=2613962 RepID=A0A5J5GFD4_9RHOB|nr:heparinase [Histidinibacterium aquaticum]